MIVLPLAMLLMHFSLNTFAHGTLLVDRLFGVRARPHLTNYESITYKMSHYRNLIKSKSAYV
jgi:hypothetical protein